MTKQILSQTKKSEWLMLISAMIVGLGSLVLGVIYMQIAQGNPWWRIGGPIALIAIAGCIWFSEMEKKKASKVEKNVQVSYLPDSPGRRDS